MVRQIRVLLIAFSYQITDTTVEVPVSDTLSFQQAYESQFGFVGSVEGYGEPYNWNVITTNSSETEYWSSYMSYQHGLYQATINNISYSNSSADFTSVLSYSSPQEIAANVIAFNITFSNSSTSESISYKWNAHSDEWLCFRTIGRYCPSCSNRNSDCPTCYGGTGHVLNISQSAHFMAFTPINNVSQYEVRPNIDFSFSIVDSMHWTYSLSKPNATVASRYGILVESSEDDSWLADLADYAIVSENGSLLTPWLSVSSSIFGYGCGRLAVAYSDFFFQPNFCSEPAGSCVSVTIAALSRNLSNYVPFGNARLLGTTGSGDNRVLIANESSAYSFILTPSSVSASFILQFQSSETVLMVSAVGL